MAKVFKKLVIDSGGGGIDGGYTVTFISDGNPYAICSVTSGQTISEPTPPTLEGFGFNGWYTDETYTSAVTFPYTPTGDVYFYAKFVESIRGTWIFNDTVNTPDILEEIAIEEGQASFTAKNTASNSSTTVSNYEMGTFMFDNRYGGSDFTMKSITSSNITAQVRCSKGVWTSTYTNSSTGMSGTTTFTSTTTNYELIKTVTINVDTINDTIDNFVKNNAIRQ